MARWNHFSEFKINLKEFNISAIVDYILKFELAKTPVGAKTVKRPTPIVSLTPHCKNPDLNLAKQNLYCTILTLRRYNDVVFP